MGIAYLCDSKVRALYYRKDKKNVEKTIKKAEYFKKGEKPPWKSRYYRISFRSGKYTTQTTYNLFFPQPILYYFNTLAHFL